MVSRDAAPSRIPADKLLINGASLFRTWSLSLFCTNVQVTFSSPCATISRNMGTPIHFGKVPSPGFAIIALDGHSAFAHCGDRRVAGASPTTSTTRGQQLGNCALLIATLPRLEIATTYSLKRRKHFLTATRTRVCPTSRVLVPGYSDSTVGLVRIENATKIDRHLCGDPLARTRSFSSHSLVLSGAEGPLVTRHCTLAPPQFTGGEPLRPTLQSAKIGRARAQR